MTKVEIDKMFQEMVKDIDTVNKLQSMNIYDFKEGTKAKDSYREAYYKVLHGLLLFDMIDNDLYNYGFELALEEMV